MNVVAKRLGLTDRRVRQMIQEGKLPYSCEGERGKKVPESAVEALRESRLESA